MGNANLVESISKQKIILYVAITNDELLSWVGNFVSGRMEITQWYKNVKLTS